MAEPPKQDRRNPVNKAEQGAAEPQTVAKSSWLDRMFSRQALVLLLVISVIGHGSALVYFRISRSVPPPPPSSEVTLGEFHFDEPAPGKGGVAVADFAVHVTLLDGISDQARRRMEDRRFRVCQGVEEILRQTHNGDFADPSLGEIKRQIQEQVNEVLGMRAVAEVIITNLRLHAPVLPAVSDRGTPSVALPAARTSDGLTQSATADRPG